MRGEEQFSRYWIKWIDRQYSKFDSAHEELRFQSPDLSQVSGKIDNNKAEDSEETSTKGPTDHRDDAESS
jgi:hypothetical protein